jgi:two-component system, OmpR family, response regulator
MRVLLVEDDKMIGAAMMLALKDAAYAVDWVKDGDSAISALSSEKYDLALVDLGSPRADGLQVLRHLRSNKDALPFIIVTARDGVDSRVEGLDLGADDYIVKPFEMRELLARMRAVSRRPGNGSLPVLTNGTVSLDPASRIATNGEASALMSPREFALLHALLMRPGTILGRGDIERHIYGWNEEVESNAVEFLIHSVRKKLGATAIRNVRGVGWMVGPSP